jgi:hypothetical protein
VSELPNSREIWPECGDWARFVLDISAEAEARRQELCLERLRESQLVPPPHWEQAVRLLCDEQGPLAWNEESGYPFFHAMEGRLHPLAAQLVHEFFDLPTAERRKRWELLVGKACFAPAIMVHMQALRPGLEVEIGAPPTGDEKVEALFQQIRRVFPLPPPLRAAHFDAFLWRVPGEARAWARAVKRLRKLRPDLAALAPKFLDCAAGRQKRVAQLESEKLAKQRPQREPVAKRLTGIPWWAVLVLAVFAASLMRGLTEGERSKTRPHYNTPPLPRFDDTSYQEALRRMREAEELRRKQPVLPEALIDSKEDYDVIVENGEIKVRPKIKLPDGVQPGFRPPGSEILLPPLPPTDRVPVLVPPDLRKPRAEADDTSNEPATH